jgi:hypothetical protein
VLTRSETELTTAATDLLLALLCFLLSQRLGGLPAVAVWKRGVWTGMLALLSFASLLGAVVHGIELRTTVRKGLWKPLYLSLGLSIALLLVGATYDGWGESAARLVLPWALLSGVLFFAMTELLGGSFLLFIAYEGIVAFVALAVYVRLASSGGLPGAAAIVLGIALSIVATAVQASRASLRILVKFDHNGLFHLLQMVGIAVLVEGVRASLLG